MKIVNLNHTQSLKSEEVKEKWLHFDATNMRCGRLASTVAYYLKGKDSPQYTPHTLSGNRIIITNVEKMEFTGKKLVQKQMYKHTQRLGALQQKNLKYMMEKDPIFVLEDAIKCMLKRTRQRKDIISKRLFIYSGSEHKHQAQQPTPMKIAALKIA